MAYDRYGCIMELMIWTIRPILGHLDYFKHLNPYEEIHGEYPTHFPKVVLTLGNECYAELQQNGIVPKNRALSSVKDMIFEHEGSFFLPTWHPEDIEEHYAYKFDLIIRLKQLQRYKQRGVFTPPSIHTQWVSHLDDLTTYCLQNNWLSLDLETKGLDPFNSENYIISMSFNSDYTCAVYLNGQMTSKLREQLIYLLNHDDIKVQGANLKYDLLWLRVKYDIVCTNFVFDTTLAGSLLDENRSNNLKLHGALFTDYFGWDIAKEYKKDMSTLDKDELLQYSSYDAFVQYKVAERFKDDLIEEERLIRKNHKRTGPMFFYKNLLHPVARLFEQIEYRGIHIDHGYLFTLKKEVHKEIELVSQQALTFIPKKLQRKYQDNLSITRAALLQDYLFTREGLNLEPLVVTKKSHKPSVSYKDHLYLFKDDKKAGDFIKQLKKYSELQKILSTYIEGFDEHVREDGLFHPTVILHKGEFEGHSGTTGTETGRLSYRDPAMMVIPKHTPDANRIRRMFIAPKGYKIIEADFAQFEMRLAAHDSQEPTMLQAYRDNKDLYKITAARTLKMTDEQFNMLSEEEQKVQRQRGKSATLGLIFVMGPKGLKVYSEKTFGVFLTEAESLALYNGFHSVYPVIKKWHKSSIQFVYEYGYRIDMLGRIRHLPQIYSSHAPTKAKAERRSVNAPIQSSANSMTLLALLEISKDEKIKPFITLHDAIYSYVPENYVVQASLKIKNIMENLPLEQFGCHLSIPLVADIKIGDNLAELQEVKM